VPSTYWFDQSTTAGRFGGGRLDGGVSTDLSDPSSYKKNRHRKLSISP